MDNIVKLFCITMIIVFGVFFSRVFFSIGNLHSTIVLKIGLIYAFATLCGAMIGSNRKYARRPHTPWTAFVAAGAMSVLLFFAIQFAVAMVQALMSTVQTMSENNPDRFLTKLSFGRVGEGNEAKEVKFQDIIPWVLLPVAASISICRISRFSYPERFGALLARVVDGVVLGAVLAFTMLFVIALHIQLDTLIAKRIELWQVQGIDLFLSILPMLGVSAALGFLMGSTSIADIRQIAKSAF